MQSSIDQLKDNKVKLTIEVDEIEVDGAIDLAFKKISKEVKLPGFRPGRVPRKVLEAKFGQEYARSEALNELIGEKYRTAVISLEVDAISQPEITITTGEESGPVSFEAIIEIRPEIEIIGYKAMSVTVPGFEATEEEINGQVDSLREQAADRNEVERPAITGDYVTVDLSGSQDGEPEESLTTEDFTYEIGSGFIVETIDENLLGTKVGEIVEFEGAHPSEEGSILSFKALVKKIEEKTLPELTDTFVSEMTEFETVEILINDTKDRIEETKRSQASNILVEQIGTELGNLVSDEPPEALVQEQIQQQLQDMAMRMGQQGMQFDQFLEATGQSIEALAENMKEPASQVVKIDLALRAVAAAEGIAVEETDIEDEIKVMAEHFNQDPENIEEIFRENGQMLTLKADLLKQQAMRFLEENVEILDPEGNKIPHDAFLLPENTDKPSNISENEDEEELEDTGGIEPQEEE
ncbi:MAG: trigger factor [Acidimicrobiales bacterium]|nr:trigger factor [Acidimicrobiales bacterium]